MTAIAPLTKKPAAIFAASVALVLGLAGCNSATPSASSSGSSSAPSASTSSTPTATPTATAAAVYKPATAKGKAQNVPLPVLPAVGKTNTKAGAEAFVTYWYALVSYAYETGNTKPVAKLTGPSCLYCQDINTALGKAWADGMWIQGGKVSPVTADRTFDISATTKQISVQVRQEPISIRLSDGTPRQDTVPASNSGRLATVTYSDGGWTLTDLGILQ